MLKKLFLSLVVTLALCGMATAQPNHHFSYNGGRCNFTVISLAKQSFWLFIDDVLQNEQAVKSICVVDVPIGEHYIRVEIDNSKHNTVGQFISCNKPNNNYCVSTKSGFYGMAAYNAPIYPEMTMNCLGSQPLPPPPGGGNMVMSNHDFDSALEMLRKESFDNTRLKIAKQIVGSNILTVNQIQQICQLFAFENNKLDFAKYAYDSCVDKNNYFKLNEVFKFDSDKQQLNQYIFQH